MAIGKIGNFLTDAPLQKNYIGEALSEVEDNSFRYRAEKRLEDEKKKAEEDAKLRELSEWNKSVKADVTGYGSIDLPIKEYLMRIKQEGGNLTQKMMNPSLPFTERVKLMGERDAMVSGIDYLKQIPTLLNSTLSEIHEGVKSGKYDADSEDQALKTIKAIEQGDFKIDPSSGSPVVTVWERDKKGNPIKIIADKQNFGDFMKENLTPELKSNYRDVVAKFHKEYVPDRTVTVDSNGREIVDQRVKMEKGSKDYLNAQENAKAILMQPQERKAVAKIAGLSPDNYEGLLDYATTDLLRGVKSEYENKQDPNLALARQKEAREAKKDQPEVPVIMEANKVDLTEDIAKSKEGGKIIINRKGIKPLAVTFEKGIPIENIGGEKTKLNNLNIKAILINDKNQIVFTGTVLDTKGGTVKGWVDKGSERTGETFKRVTRTASGEIEGAIASKMGFENVNQLKEYMNKIQPKQKQKNNTQGAVQGKKDENL